MKLKIFFLYCLVLGLSGCMPQKQLDETCKLTSDLFAASSIYYHSHNNHWPASIDELKSFCSQTPENCPSLDWNKYSHTQLTALTDGSLKIESYVPDDANMPINGKKPNFTITVHKPIKQENGNSLNN